MIFTFVKECLCKCMYGCVHVTMKNKTVGFALKSDKVAFSLKQINKINS